MEDNGQTLPGMYSLHWDSTLYVREPINHVLGAPLFKKRPLHLENGHTLQ